ncbi:MAG: birA, biotin-(acetyl-CoA-carboxylase) ligase [Actinomycetia bacterium]|nr:birA, biotin-(acetyl-CoA-carboxylase) ligase [Actinomycetes bacterium]
MLGPAEILDEIDSTNAELRRRAAAGAPAGLVLVARHQTAGRGRRDRSWEAPPGSSLLVSVLLRPTLEVEDLHLCTVTAGLAALRACAAEGEVGASLKWPNDVVVDGPDGARKLAGLLAESVVEGNRVAALVVGMGLNVNWPAEVPGGGVALNQLLGRAVDGDGLLRRWVEAFGSLVAGLATAEGRDQVRDAHRAACSTIGRRVRVEATGGPVEGVAEAIDHAGHLVLSDGRTFAVGDVVHVRHVSAT